jgi:hypothetical protein
MRRTIRPFLLAFIGTATLAGSLASVASAGEIRSVTADDYGNAVILTTGGAKIIAVGQADLAAGYQGVAASADIVAAPVTTCREVGIVLKGRSFMYGVGDGDPVPLATRVICD